MFNIVDLCTIRSLFCEKVSKEIFGNLKKEPPDRSYFIKADPKAKILNRCGLREGVNMHLSCPVSLALMTQYSQNFAQYLKNKT